MTQKTIKTGSLYRSFELSRAEAQIDQESRTVSLAFSSEMPVERGWGKEILDHNTNSVRLGRLNGKGPLLVDHDRRDHIGVVESVSIDADRKGRAVVRFGKSERANEIFSDVVDGVRSHVSVGYRIHKMRLESEEDDEETYRATDWEPYEISIVSMPADTTVGVGRDADDEFQTQLEVREMSGVKPEHEEVRTPEPNVQVDMDKAQKDWRRSELERIENIEALGDAHGEQKLAREFVKSGKSVEEFRSALLKKIESRPIPNADIGMSTAEVKRFSFVRAMNFLANPNDRRAREAAAFEIECSEAAISRTGRTAQGLMVPSDVMKRDLVVGTATAGGHTVATDLLAGSFIDLLRNRMVVNRLGATYLTDLVGNIAIPRQTSGATAYWVAESGAPTESQQAFDQVTLSPKTVGAYTDYSRKLMLQSSIDVESFVRMDLARVLGLAIDLAALYGSGASNQPTGVVNTTGINNGTTFAGADPTFAEVVALESEVAADNADIGTLAYVTDAAMRGAFKTTEKASGTAQFIWEPGNTVNGYRCEISNQMTDGDVIFGNWADLLIGLWGGLDLMVDPYSNSTSGTVRIVALQDVDIAVRHPESFALGNDTP